MKKPETTAADLQEALRLVEADAQVLRRAMEIVRKLGLGVGELTTERQPTTAPQVRERQTQHRPLSDVHAYLLNVVHMKDPVMAADVLPTIPARLFGEKDVELKDKSQRLSRWLNEMKNKGLIAAAPNNPADRNKFKWTVTERGKTYITQSPETA